MHFRTRPDQPCSSCPTFPCWPPRAACRRWMVSRMSRSRCSTSVRRSRIAWRCWMSFTRWASAARRRARHFEQAIEQFRADVDHEFRNYGIAYFPHLNTSLVRANDLDYTWFEPAGLQDFVLNEALKLFPNPQDDAVRVGGSGGEEGFCGRTTRRAAKRSIRHCRT